MIANNKIGIIAKGDMEIFAILSSRVFTVWNKSVSGRLESRLNVSITITYNNFPFLVVTETLKDKLAVSAKMVLEARAMYPESSLAELYEPTSMPSVLATAHTKLDTEVLSAYGLKPNASDSEILEVLFTEYAKQTGNQ